MTPAPIQPNRVFDGEMDFMSRGYGCGLERVNDPVHSPASVTSILSQLAALTCRHFAVDTRA